MLDSGVGTALAKGLTIYLALITFNDGKAGVGYAGQTEAGLVSLRSASDETSSTESWSSELVD